MRASIRHRPLGLVLAGLVAASFIPGMCHAAENVECKLPGEVHSVGGHSMMSAGRIVQTTPDDCRQRGGEYTVQEQPPLPPPATTSVATMADGGTMVSCLLPAQTRQLGEKAQYRTTRHSVRTTRSDCQARGGTVYTPHKSRTTHHK